MAGRLVYDSDAGVRNECPTCGKRLDRCACGQARRALKAPAAPPAGLPRDGTVRVMRDRKHRGGKVVTLIAGLPALEAEPLGSELKRLCGSGGTVKDDTVEIQGDHRERVVELLRQRGYQVKLAGG